MQKKNCVLCISIGIIVCILLSACSRQPDFDAKSYVQSSLDAHYHGEYKDYANLLEISEKDAKKEIEEDFNESIQQQFDDSDNITDKGIADYTEKLAEVKKLAKYKVQDVKEEDGVYTVSVQVEPSNVFQTLHLLGIKPLYSTLLHNSKNPPQYSSDITDYSCLYKPTN